jgi:osmotically-inducible protein OsmY
MVQAVKMSPQDESVWFKARVELKINPLTEAFGKTLKLGVNRGMVTLEGTVPSEADVKAAERVVLTVVGVSGVINKLTVA